ncbi:MAG: DUF922 domain-containing protein [Aeromonadaceae bacterium]
MRNKKRQLTGLVLLLTSLAVVADEPGYSSVKVDPRMEVNFSFYDISAADGQTLKQKLLERAPVSTPGHRAIGKAVYQVNWQLDMNQQDNKCQLFGVKVSTKVKVIMPNWLQVSTLNSSAQNSWNGFLSAMMEYEGRHKEIVQDAARKIGDGISTLPVNSSCQNLREQADKLGLNELQQARDQVKRYQAETGHGRYLGVNYPRL